MRCLSASWALALVLYVTPPVNSAEDDKPKPYEPKVSGPSEEAQKAQKTIRLAEGLHVELVAAEPLLANPVSFYADHQGKFYIAETFRHSEGTTDTRSHMYWLDDDLACRTVEDRVAMYKKHLGKEFDDYAKESDRVRLLVDKDGDGKIDTSTVFAEGFNAVPDGIGAGLLAYKGDVFFTCIPKLWKLRDTNGDGVADVRTALHHGYGVHVAFIGHDLHGLRIGPDGKLYFSIGDRGLNITQDGRSIYSPDTGAVLRCNLDGSELELFATGLRNPQELVFDQYGHLFTGDNNSDGGDRARFVHLVEGSDSGWRIGYQYLEGPYRRGPWNDEKLWYPRWDGQAAYIWPPIANLGDGPSGLTYDPGTSSLPVAFKDHFFLCDFRGASGQSGIRSWALKQSKLGYEIIDSTQPIWSVLATDVDFGPDGDLYITDWVEGWPKPGKGRLWKVGGTSTENAAKVKEVKNLLAAGTKDLKIAELAELLAHADQRVRQEAQFEIVNRGDVYTFTKALASGSPMAKLHAIWGLGQLGKKDLKGLPSVVDALSQPDAHLREAAATVLGNNTYLPAFDALVSRLKDEEPMVCLAAAVALSKLKKSEAVGPILAMVQDNKDQSLYIRHGGIVALTALADVPTLARAATNTSRSVRLASVVSLRRLGRPEVADFLADSDPAVVLEAARAINDAEINDATGSLAKLADRSELPEPLLRRVINANLRMGGSQSAKRLAALAIQGKIPDTMRVEALVALGDWAKPRGRDRVTGLWRPIAERPIDDAALALKAILPQVLAAEGIASSVQIAATEAVARLAIRDAGPLLVKLVGDTKLGDRDRIAALKALETLVDPRLADVAKLVLTDTKPRVRSEGLRVIAKLEPAKALPLLGGMLESGTARDQQAAFSILGDVKAPEADALLTKSLDDLIGGKTSAEVELDILEAAGKHPSLSARVADFENTRAKNDPLSAWRECISGGDATKGRDIFFNKGAVQCLRCHKAEGRGGEVGPVLDAIALRGDRRYLLESIVLPNAKIAEGFETVVAAKLDGQVITGVLKGQNDKELRLMTAEAKLIVIPKSEIEEQKRGDSAMPTDILKSLSKSEIRDVVEWLSTLKSAKDADAHGK